MKKNMFNRFIKKFSKAIESDNAAIFAGAGMSAPAGFVNWSQLLTEFAEEIGLDSQKEFNLVKLAQYYVNERMNKSEISNKIIEEFYFNDGIPVNHKILAQLPIKTYWTTNYDSLIEESLREVNKIVDVKHTVNQLAITIPNRDVIVYKMHGDKDYPYDVILTKDDYERYESNYGAFITALKGQLVSKTFLFVGFSFDDPNLEHILSSMRKEYKEHQRAHYAIFKKVSKEDIFHKINNNNNSFMKLKENLKLKTEDEKKFDQFISAEIDKEFEYETRKQDLFCRDLRRYNINALLVDEYSEITEILTDIKNKIRAPYIFVSGSAHEYKEFNDDVNISLKFIRELSKRIIGKNYKIVSGFGLGVGGEVISGALEELYMNKKTRNDNELIIKPFPQSTKSNDIKELWTSHRREIIGVSGVSIFIFGNKVDENGKLINANGLKEEFEISKENKNIIVPVGITGYKAREIWRDVNNNFDSYYKNSSEKLKKLFAKLNTEQNYEKLIDIIIEFINECKKLNI